MRKLLIFLSAILVVLLGMWGTLVLYFDEARLKQIAIEQVRAQTGRELQIDGELKLDFFPGVSLLARDVRLSGPEAYTGPDLFSADEFRMSIALLPLLSGRVETGDIGLTEAELNIHTDRRGLSTLDGLTGGSEPADPGAETPEVSTGVIALSNIRLNISDAATDSRQVFVVERLKIDNFRFDAPVPFEFRGSVGDPAVVSDIELVAQLLVPSGSGPIRVDGLELAAVASGLTIGLAGNADLEPGPPLLARFRDGRVVLGDAEFETSFTYREAARPKIEASLRGTMLDVDALLATLPEVEAGAPAEDGESPLLMLRDLDLDARLELDAMRVSGLDLREINARMQAVRGTVTIDPLSGALSGGRLDAVGVIDLNAAPPTVRLAPVFDLQSLAVALAPWGLDRFLSGSGVLDLELNARGLSPAEILGSLDGSGQYSFRDGAINGIDLDGMVQGLAARNIAEAVRSGVGGSTAFETLAGVIEVRDGSIRLPGMSLITGLLGVRGDVRLGLADLALDGELRLDGERVDEIPVRLGGTLLAPKLTPDVGEALKQEAGRRVLDLLQRRGERDKEPDDGSGDGG
jgi:AsmA protein